MFYLLKNDVLHGTGGYSPCMSIMDRNSDADELRRRLSEILQDALNDDTVELIDNYERRDYDEEEDFNGMSLIVQYQGDGFDYRTMEYQIVEYKN